MDFTVKKFDELTTGELYEILKSRAEVFLLEQNIICQDLDDEDYRSTHFFMTDGKRVTAYLRAFYKDEAETVLKIGRVLTLNHGQGIGRELFEKSLNEIRKSFNCKKICINAQKYAAGFYEKFGFEITSDEFLEEGVVHIAMELRL